MRHTLPVIVLGVAALVAGQSADAILTVRTQPEGVEVWLDDIYVGDSPVEQRRVPAGRHRLRLVSATLRVSETEELYLQPQEHKVVEKTLSTKYGSLHVLTQPPGAEVVVGSSLGVTPLANDLITPGTYRVEIRPPNNRYKGITEQITVTPGGTTRIERSLERTSPFTTKALLRVLLGVGAVGGFTWAIIEQGENRTYWEKSRTADDSAERAAYLDKSEKAALWRTVGIVIGGVCTLGFEIVAFF